ncbi:MAG TPA: hypothetical protein VJ998_07950, partial [Pseudomonadales bacterium]|nr:hypothetical protein [Pseudomonadales bacterium]
RKVTFSVIALGTASAIVPHSRAVVFAALQTQTATWLLLLVAVAAFVALLREGATPPGDKDLRFARNIQADLFSRAHISRAQRMTWLPLKRMTGPAAFDAAFEHSPLQAWLNDSIIVLLALGMGVMTFVIGAREPAQVALIVSAMSALLATILPMVTRGITLNISDFLWLCGSHGNKQQLARAMFIRLMRSPLRICVMALVLGQLILGFGPDSNLARLSCSLLLCAPGGAAIILAVAFMLGRQLDAETGSSIAVLSLVMTTTMLVGGIAALAGASLPPITMVVSTSLGSGLVTVIAAIVVSRWLASRRAWIQ